MHLKPKSGELLLLGLWLYSPVLNPAITTTELSKLSTLELLAALFVLALLCLYHGYSVTQLRYKSMINTFIKLDRLRLGRP